MTLTVHAPNPTGRYTGSLTLVLVPTHPVTVTIRTYVNYTTGWIPGEVEACAVNCSTEANAQTVTLWTNYTYTLTLVDVASGVDLRLWNTTTGTLSSDTSNPTTVPLQRAGVIASVMSYSTMRAAWAGYVSSPNSSSEAISGVSAVIDLPSGGTGSSGAFWMGIGGVGGGGVSLWQAGVIYNANDTLTPFWEIAATCTGCGVIEPNYTMDVSFGDKVEINLSVAHGVSYFSIFDQKTGKTWSGSAVFQPNTSSADWVEEPTYGNPYDATFTDLTVNGTFTSLQTSLFSFFLTGSSGLTPSVPMLESSGHVEFTLS